MTTIIDELLTLSRLELATDDGNVERVKMNELLTATVAETRIAHAEQDPPIELACDPDLQILGHRELLHSAVANLLLNAVRHTPPRTRIRVNCSQDENGGARLEVCDQGSGIAARHLPRLTERFYRVDEGRSTASGGTGLGLAIVKHALDRHDAELEISSEPGKGSVFSCRFPPHRVIAGDMRQSAPAQAEPTTTPP